MDPIFRRPKEPGHYQYDWVAFLDGNIIGFVRCRERYANIRPRSITWKEWSAFTADHTRLPGAYATRAQAAHALTERVYS